LELVRETAKRLIGEASEAHDFTTVTRVAAIAEKVDQIISEVMSGVTAPAAADVSRPSGLQATGATVPTEVPKRHGNSGFSGAKNARNKAEYPTFLREGTDLVKVGRSRSSPDLYEHRAPRDLVDHVVKAVFSVGSTGKRFSADAVLKQVSSGQGAGTVPSYQVYVALAWLKWSGLIIQHGRQGYTVASPQRFGDVVRSAWEQLGTR
jgi:hypothetical protein